MANIKSQVKRNKQNEIRRIRNKSVRSELRTRVRNALEAAEGGEAEVAKEAFRNAQKRIDEAASRGIIHANTAARRKARLAAKLRNSLT